MTLSPRRLSDGGRSQIEVAASRATMILLSALAFVVLSPHARALAETIDVSQSVQKMGSQIKHTTIIVERQSDGQIWSANADRAKLRYSPASTSKIPHTLIALESGVASLATVFHWDGVPRSNRQWNQDQSLASAFQNSVVWVYQVIARTAGKQTMSAGLASFDYGNASVGSADQLTTYWLDDTLQISAEEQIEFLSKIALEQLPVSKATYSAARDIMVTDQTDNWVMRSKSGWRHSKEEMDIGWYVGWLECASETYVFALNMDMPDTRSLSRRKEVTHAILQDIGAFDCG